jgi:hypothetical protein
MRRFLSLLAVLGSSGLFVHCGSTIVVVPCFDDETDCGGDCVDTSSDPNHCGGCGVLCPVEQGLQCVDSVCVGDVDCPPGLVDCGGGACVDLTSDPFNCGGCNVVCPTGDCIASSCIDGCPDPLEQCPDGCVDVFSDPFNCGGCNIQCPSGWSCQGASCFEPTCPPNLTLCGGECVDTLFDSQHCGDCFNVCPFDSFCDFGECVGACSPGACSSCGGEVQLPFALSFSTVGTVPSSPSGIDGVCGDGQSSEVAHIYTAPTTGTYFISAAVEGQEATLMLFDDSCNLIGCGMAGEILIDLTQGSTIVATVDSTFGGFYELVVEGTPAVIECPTGTITTVPATITGTTIGASDNFLVSCGGGGGPDRSFLFTAPATDVYRFDTVGSDYDTVLEVRGGECAGPVVDCDDDGGGNVNSLVEVSLTQGQVVTVLVDGFAGNVGNFTLNVTTP